MAFKHYVSFSLVFLATASIFLANEAQAHAGVNNNNDLCCKSDYPALCRSLIKGQTNPFGAAQTVVNHLIMETQRAKKHVARFGSSQSQVIGICQDSYDDALDNLHTCLGNLKGNDKGSFNSNLSAALSDFEVCNDGFNELGESSPVKDVNSLLENIADTGLYLESLVH
ncbi:putative invertase inhibitor [Ziziphus jujuba]|uniref:Invertase inhibitor n=2 Tax=Ziziphus jujuba TaxID=326968 RepID=A0A6P4AII1_ZIZJJ|nr:putative invertase inhibitor [Ziziphus jujuba]KAH7515690.1 hypothetical protein FEM48_Zijuj10G0053300 [Ziziphus jujuba var. spinosa]